MAQRIAAAPHVTTPVRPTRARRRLKQLRPLLWFAPVLVLLLTVTLPLVAGLSLGLMRPGKGVHVTFERRIGNFGMILEAKDGRTMFLVPHGSETIVGRCRQERAHLIGRPVANG